MDEAGVAAAMGLSCGSVKTHTRRAKAALKQMLSQSFISLDDRQNIVGRLVHQGKSFYFAS
jgi:hypothetical protein